MIRKRLNDDCRWVRCDTIGYSIAVILIHVPSSFRTHASAAISRWRNRIFQALRAAHGSFSGNGRPADWVAADIVRIEGGKLAEHRDVAQDEATKAQSVSGLPMFGDRFPD
jgi:hypothetical protein